MYVNESKKGVFHKTDSVYEVKVERNTPREALVRKRHEPEEK